MNPDPAAGPRFDAWTVEGMILERNCTLARAAQIAEPDAAETAWAAEACCRADTLTILPAGETWTPYEAGN